MEILKQLARFAASDRTAIVYADDTLSYLDLNRRSDAFAAFLRSQGQKRRCFFTGTRTWRSRPACSEA